MIMIMIMIDIDDDSDHMMTDVTNRIFNKNGVHVRVCLLCACVCV